MGVKTLKTEYCDIQVSIENPAGKLDTIVTARSAADHIEIKAAAYRRSTQILMRGHVPLYQASSELIRALKELS